MGQKPHILIAGAGIGGLVAALALLRNGIDVDIYEQTSELAEVGAGVQIGANGNRVLFALGLRDELERIASQTLGKEVRLWNTGQGWPILDMGTTSVQQYGFPYFTLHRSDFHELLVRAVRREKPDAIHLKAKCVVFTQSQSSVTLQFDGGARVTGDALIGADGIHSRIRQGLFGADRPHYTGCMAWRGLAPAATLPTSMQRPMGVMWVGPGAHIVHYPVRKGEFVNLFGCVVRDDWRVESWHERGSCEECSADYPGWHPDIQALIAGISVFYKWALIVHEPLQRWTVGRVTLMGDACHSTLPFLAQGANMAIEDGYVLAQAVSRYPSNIEQALTLYETARRDRCNHMVNLSAEQGSRVHDQAFADPALAVEKLRSQWSEERVNDRYDWLYEYDATTAIVD